VFKGKRNPLLDTIGIPYFIYFSGGEYPMKRMLSILSVLVLASMLLAACGTPQTIVETKIVEVEKTVEVQVPVPSAFATAPFALTDLAVRQAIAYCTNKLDLVKSVYPLVKEEAQKKLIMDSFIPSYQWAYAGDENITIYPYDPEKGKALLDGAGWTMQEGSDYRANADGIELALKFTTTNAAFRQTWAAVFENQMKDCGIHIIRLHAPASWWFGDTTGLAHRDFELGAFAWVGQADPGGQTLYACDQIPLPTNGWVGQNDMGWCNQAASDNIKIANNRLLQADRKAAYTIVQQEFTKDVPSIPLFNRTATFAYAPGLVNFEPKAGEEYYMYNADQWENPGKDTIVLGFTQEPATLFTLVEQAYVTQAAMYLVSPRTYTTKDYNFEPNLVKQLSTLESGLATNTPVDVKEGDIVQDATGSVVPLAAGTQVINSDGETVTYASGDPLKMNQLVVKYEFLDGLKFSDGQPLSKVDYELGQKIQCDKESGATSFILCDKTQKFEATDTGYTVTWVPGDQDPLYFEAPFGWYPAHEVIQSEGAYKGKTLAEVPAKDWATLPEIAEKPMDVGPYVLKEWVKGEKMVFEANPYWVKGAPKTPNIVISFITAENAEAQLLSGQVDVLDDTTLAGVSQTLKDAAEAGAIKLLVNPSATWEHIDMNLGK
jgi:ABC-type transport system substrate-binding protein